MLTPAGLIRFAEFLDPNLDEITQEVRISFAAAAIRDETQETDGAQQAA